MKYWLALFKKELLLEFRLKHAAWGILIYLLSTVFVSYLSFKKIGDVPTWNALFWIIALFMSVNAVAKSFQQESIGRTTYLYTLVSPRHLILAKTLYNGLFMVLLLLVGYLIYSLLLGDLVQNHTLFLLVLVLGGFALGSTFTMISAISAQTGNNSTMMAILGFPVLLPILLTTIALSKQAIDGLPWEVSTKYIFSLIALNAIVSTLGLLLFPYLWRD